MPLLRTETIHGVVCKFYDCHVVKVSTGADRFTIRVPTDELLWVATRVRAELIARELATAEELPIDDAGEAAMAANAAAKARAAAAKAACRMAEQAASKREEAAAALDAAKHHEDVAGLKRQMAETQFKMADMRAKVARAAVPLMSEATATSKAPIQAKLEAFMRPRPVGS